MEFKAYDLEAAQEILLSKIKIRTSENIKLKDACGSILAQDIYAPINVPQFRKSPLDGFTLKAADTKEATIHSPLKIKIIDEVQAGDTRVLPDLAAGCGVKILTGAPLPPGADVVIRKEDVELINGEIAINKELAKDSNIIEIGDDIKEGELIFKEGEILTPYHISVLASLGFADIKCYKSPEIAILSTGNELKNPGEPLEFGQIYNSNLHGLTALVNSLGGNACPLDNVSDHLEDIKAEILTAVEKHDMVITTGGASVGDYDLIQQALEEIGAEILFNRVNIKPGSPVISGVKNDKMIIGLSGNPAACLISFELLVRPLIKKLKGTTDTEFKKVDVVLVDGFKKKSPQRRFVRVKVKLEDGKWLAEQTGNQQSSILRSMVGCNGLIDIPADFEPIMPGALVKALLLKEDLLCYHP